MTAITVLRNSAWFKQLPEQAIQDIAALSEIRNFQPGEVIFQRGEQGDSLFGIIVGLVNVSTSSLDGRELTLNTQGPGSVGGEIAVMDGGPRTATWTAAEATTAFVISRSSLRTLMLHQPEIALHVIELLCARIRESTLQVEDAAFRTVAQRLARRLQLFAQDEQAERDASGAVVVRLSQNDLAVFLNASRQVVNKTLKSWQALGFVELGRNKIIIRALDEIMVHVTVDE